MSLSRKLWPVKIGAKVVLARLPIPYGVWHRIGAFRHGKMNEAEYAKRVFDGHCTKSLATGLAGRSLLEMGPGDSLLSAVFARWGGAARMTLVDVGAFADRDVGIYRAAAAPLAYAGPGSAPQPEAWRTIEEMLEDCRAVYLTDGLASLRAVPSESVDHSWSNAVLEHVRHAELAEQMRELARATVPGGTTSHQVDFRDHLGGGRAHLRVGSRLWEQDWFALRSGFYTNRWQYTAVKRHLESAGFAVTRVSSVVPFDEPVDRTALAAEFRGLDDDSLTIAGARFEAVKSPVG